MAALNCPAVDSSSGFVLGVPVLVEVAVESLFRNVRPVVVFVRSRAYIVQH